MFLPTINTRADLDAMQGTPAYAEFIAYLKGTLTRRVNAQVYPEGYNNSLAEGAEGYLPPLWQDVPDDTTAARFGFTREALLAL